jgi:predicted PurR-regulated permease PerM
MTEGRAVPISLVICALVLSLFAIERAAAILAPVTFAIFIVIIVWPLQRRLQSRMPTLLAALVTITTTLAAIAVIVYLMIWGFGLVFEWLFNNTARFQELYTQATVWLYDHGVSLRGLMIENYNPAWLVGIAREIGGRSYQLISFSVIVFAFVVLGLLEVDVLRYRIEHLDNRDTAQSLLKAGQDIADKFRRYMMVRTVMSVITGVMVWSFALVTGIELATAWGVIAFTFNYIPIIGPLVATVFPTLFALAQFESWQLAIVVFLVLNAVQFVTGSYIEPRMAGARLSISPFVVLLAVFFWTFLWGIAGTFIGVPITIAALVICHEYKSTRWIATLLAGRGKEVA